MGARFALDGMPGKQLAIDSDMNAGAIGSCRGKTPPGDRNRPRPPSSGSLDGASKFVKGDAIAGLLITVLNLVMGLIMGIAVHAMPLGQAFGTYAILTVGDGLGEPDPGRDHPPFAAALLLGARAARPAPWISPLGRPTRPTSGSACPPWAC